MGASIGGENAYRILKEEGIQITAFIDNNEKNGVKVY